jgi:hypothetical protein
MYRWRPSSGASLFPASKAELIRGLVARDLPFYDAWLSRHSIASLNGFATDVGLLDKMSWRWNSRRSARAQPSSG